jgi:hypothetical protein
LPYQLAESKPSRIKTRRWLRLSIFILPRAGNRRALTDPTPSRVPQRWGTTAGEKQLHLLTSAHLVAAAVRGAQRQKAPGASARPVQQHIRQRPECHGRKGVGCNASNQTVAGTPLPKDITSAARTRRSWPLWRRCGCCRWTPPAPWRRAPSWCAAAA